MLLKGRHMLLVKAILLTCLVDLSFGAKARVPPTRSRGTPMVKQTSTGVRNPSRQWDSLPSRQAPPQHTMPASPPHMPSYQPQLPYMSFMPASPSGPFLSPSLSSHAVPIPPSGPSVPRPARPAVPTRPARPAVPTRPARPGVEYTQTYQIEMPSQQKRFDQSLKEIERVLRNVDANVALHHEKMERYMQELLRVRTKRSVADLQDMEPELE